MFLNICSLIVVLVYVVNVEECMKELILIVIFLVIMILFVIRLMNVYVPFICIAMLVF